MSTVDAKPFRWAARAGAIAAILVVAGPVIPTFSLGTRRFFQVMEGENQAYVTFALKLGGFRGPGTYPLSVRRGRRVRRDLQRLAV